MDVGSGKGYPADKLSNFAPHPFVFQGVECASMEGLLQSFKFDKIHIQAEVCKLIGLAAKRRGQKRNKTWKQSQTLWWNGVSFNRHSPQYQALLDLAFDALFENEGFRRALAATQNAVLTHKIGNSDPSQTVLTEREFCSRLTNCEAVCDYCCSFWRLRYSIVMSNDAQRAESYRKILLKVLDDLDDEKPYDPLVRRILATMAHFDDLKGVSDRFVAIKMLPKPIRNAIIENAEREGQAIIAAKTPVIPDWQWRKMALRPRKKNTRD